MGTKSNPGAFDCYANAAPDEPMFILLARDKHAPTLIWLWASLRELDQENPDTVANARDIVEDMLQWQLANKRSAIGLGHAALVGVMELIRMANSAVVNAPNPATRDEELRRMLSRTLFESPAGQETAS